MKFAYFLNGITRFSWLFVFIALLLSGCSNEGESNWPLPVQAEPVTLSSIAITPPSATILSGTTAQLMAVGTYSDGRTADISSSVVWTTGSSSTATVSNTGLVTGVVSGETSVSAELDGITSPPVGITVTPATLIDIVLTPASASIAHGSSTTLRATGTFSDGITGDISGSVTWTTAGPDIVNVASSGEVMGNAVGTTTITAALHGVVSLPANITVTAVLSSIAITPASAAITQGSTTTLNATATYSDGSTADISNQVSWASADSGVASIDEFGVVTGVAEGAADITASLNGITSPVTSIKVNAAILSGIEITPASATSTTGGTTTFRATGTYSDGSTGDISGFVIWHSSDPSVAMIDANGIATGLDIGTTSISANTNAVTSNTAMLTIPDGIWTTKAPLLHQRDNAVNAVLNGKIYVFGGAPAGTSVLASMEVYDPLTDTWPLYDTLTSTAWPDMPEPRYGPAAATFNDVIYVVGGTRKVNGQSPIYPIFVYDPMTNRFSSTVPGTSTPLADIPTGRWGFDMAVVDGVIYAIGGAVYVPGGITPDEWDYKITGANSGGVITALKNGLPYYFVVTAVDASGLESPASFTVSATPMSTNATGAIPSGVGTAAGNGQATLNWTGVTGASSYNIYYSNKSGDSTSNMEKAPGITTTSSTISGLNNGMPYYFVVTAMVGGVETQPSTEVAVMPQTTPGVNVPTGVSVTSGDGQAILSWSPVPNAVSYNVYYGDGHNTYYGTVEAYNPVANTWTEKAPMPTPRRGMAVSVVNGLIYAIGGWGGWPELSVVEVYDPASDSWSTTVPINAGTIAAGTAGKLLAPMPTARDDFGFAVVNGSIYTIGGDINTFDAALGIPCCTTVNEAYDTVRNSWRTEPEMPTMRDDHDASLVDGVIYAIAGSRDGIFDDPTLPNNGGYSLTVNEAYIKSNTPVPNGVTATSAVNQVLLSWNAVAGASSYNIYWSYKAGVSTIANRSKIANVTTNTYNHDRLFTGKWYYYVVTAVTAEGESLPSNEVAIKP